MITDTLASATCVVRNTGAKKGRTQAVTPGPAMQYLHYGRVVLDAGDAPIRFETNERETALVCLRGNATVVSGDTRTSLERYDTIYVPRDSSVEVSANEQGCDFICRSAFNNAALGFTAHPLPQSNPVTGLNAGMISKCQ